MTGRPGNRNPDVEAWSEKYKNPQRELVAQIREFILGSGLDPESVVIRCRCHLSGSPAPTSGDAAGS